MIEGDANGRNLDMFSQSVKLHGGPDYTPSHHQRRVQQITDRLYRFSFHSRDSPQSGVARLSVTGLNRSMMVVSQRSQKTFADKRMQKLWRESRYGSTDRESMGYTGPMRPRSANLNVIPGSL